MSFFARLLLPDSFCCRANVIRHFKTRQGTPSSETNSSHQHQDFPEELQGHPSQTTPLTPGLSGGNSGKNPERSRKRSQNFSWNSPRENGWDPPSPFIHSRTFPEFSPPQYGWGRLFFQKRFRRGPLRAGHGIPSSTGGISESTDAFLQCTFSNWPTALTSFSQTCVPQELSGPIRDTPHIAQHPFELVSQRGVSHPFAWFS